MTSVDLMWAVMAIRIQREVGGNLAELLDTVADTMTQRERMRLRDPGAHGGRTLLGLDPRASSRSRSPAILYLIQPDYMGDAVRRTRSASWPSSRRAVMTFVGFIWLRKILAIEV